jgi:hypothetical protein
MSEDCYFFKFLLFVTGKGESKHLQKIFRDLEASRICSFKVVEKIGQREGITSVKKQVKMVGKGKNLPSKDFDEISAPARRHVSESPCNRLLLIDDLEQLNPIEAASKFKRYRQALDEGLRGTSRESHASVHFLVRMLEAYFFADINAVNQALQIDPPIPPYTQDVEKIKHPKSELKKHFPSYKEKEDSGLVLDKLCLDTVLANPVWCASLRTCVKWIVEQLRAYPRPETVKDCRFDERFHLTTGTLYSVTDEQ